ncbi:MurR/RpiR family transcriptional regulator [Alcaligenes parafaecalis]|uniref:MurR/RpiR family transcriptional regulator n=1 Tax=Alcaligenes parafaecalis TaxID=171260 RepID=A0ABT3VP40_9BURK|nr:MurR/RpiR family transcriptional regulator [Alcaligenes parafaecalis]MCX5465303.1 MurR/RpiR family transcriptional regulator [Alcaligenes parafaecalis]
MNSLSSLTVRIQAAFATLSPQFQQSARYVLDHADQIPLLSMRQLAAQAQVQPATLLRFAQSLGFAGWAEFKAVFTQALHGQGARRYADQARVVVRNRHKEDRLEQALTAQMDNLALLREANEARLPQAVELLSKAKRVFVAGFRASFAPAFSFHYQYRLFRPSIVLLRGESGTLDMDLRALQKGDVLVLFGFAPYSQEAVLAHRAAQQADAHILAICDSLLAPIAQQADATLLFGTDSPSFFPSLVAAQALVEVLLEQVLAKAGSRAVSGIELLEDQLHQSGAYWK